MSGPVVYFVRHGETAWSLTGQHTGKTDLPLTPRGEEEARALWPKLQDIGFTNVFSSPRQRALQSCELAGQSAAVRVDPDLAEWDYGDYEGVTSVDIRRDRPDWNIFRDGCPNGEAPDQVVARADRLVAQLRCLSGNIALFSHGHFGQVFVAHWIGWQVREAEHFVLDPASLSILGTRPGTLAVPAILRWNCL